MKRRDFIQVIGVTSLMTGTGMGCLTTKNTKSGLQLKNWAWLGGGKNTTDEEWMELLQKLKDHRIHGVVPSGLSKLKIPVG